MFEHEKLQVYQLGRELNREFARLAKLAGKGAYDHVDQLVRTGASITRNTAEGCGEWMPREKAKFYRYAKRSATEAAACLDVLVDYQMLREEQTRHAKELLGRIIPMLLKLIQKFEGGDVRTSSGGNGVDRPSTGTSTSPKTMPAPPPPPDPAVKAGQ